MNNESITDLGLKLAYQQIKRSRPVLQMTLEETEEFYFNIGFRKGYAFKEFCLEQQSEDTNQNRS